MSKTKALKEILEAAPDEVAKILRALKGESDDAVQTLGSGKNLDALKKAQIDAPSMEAPAYPKNVTQDELGQVSKDFKLVGEPQSKDFTMPHPEATVPAVRGNTLPDGLPKGGGPVSVVPEMMDEVQGPMLPALRKNTQPDIIAEMADPKKSNMLRNSLIGGGLAVGGGAALMGLQDEGKADGMPILPAIAAAGTTALVNNMMSPKSAEQAPVLPRSPATEAPKAQPQVAAPVAPVDEEAEYLKELKAAQAKENDLNFIDNMLRAGTTVGAAVSRTKADYTNVDALQKQNSKGVENVKAKMTADMDNKKLKKVQQELDDDKKLRDPKSDVSTAFRQALSKLGIKHTDKTSAADAKAMGINIQNLLMHEKTIDAQLKKADKVAGDKVKSFKLAAFSKVQKPFQEYKKVADAYDAVTSLNDHLSKPNGAKDIQTLYSFIKGLDRGSSVKEGEIALTQEGMSLFEKAGIKAKKLTTGQILSPDFRQQIFEVLKNQKEIAEKGYQDEIQPLLLQGADYGLTEEDHGDIDPLSAMKAKSGKPQAQAPKETVELGSPKKPGAIIRSGDKTFVVNADGKTATEQ